jgi:hypothetical protein
MISVIENLSGRDIVLTLRPGEIAQPGVRAVEPVKVTLGPKADKPLEGRAASKIRLAEVCKDRGLDVKDVSEKLSKSGFIEQMKASGIIAVA